MSEWKARRFWEKVQVTEVAGGFGVELDGHPVRTPGKSPLVLPTRPMAEAIAEEWRAQHETINPLSMPATRTANSAIEKVAPQHQAVADMLAAYGDSDLLCYRADSPEALVTRQAEGWDPMLDWAAEVLDARLEPRIGVMHRPQDPKALDALTRRTRTLDHFELAAFHDLVSLSGSLVLGFAAALDARDIDMLWQLSRIDETFQAEHWGSDADAEMAAELKRQSFVHAKRMYDLAQPEMQ